MIMKTFTNRKRMGSVSCWRVHYCLPRNVNENIICLKWSRDSSMDCNKLTYRHCFVTTLLIPLYRLTVPLVPMYSHDKVKSDFPSNPGSGGGGAGGLQYFFLPKITGKMNIPNISSMQNGGFSTFGVPFRYLNTSCPKFRQIINP